ncbi:MAG: 23S rRNA (pseudouridine(1915)-N(3))-methyltransferase RlmH [Ferruginibacter sp.]|nr:23S rRNA (pseudouridine(1915)-N(3))-methyltransferase RlmH [Ferruginibacter sp.]
MKITIFSVGKSHEKYLEEGIKLFSDRISHYYPIHWEIIPPPRHAGKMDVAELKSEEGRLILSRLLSGDCLILLDERGKLLSSPDVAALITQKANQGISKLVFLIGGAYGVSEDVKARAQLIWSLSPLVFPHMLVRLILSEQLYRACTILRNEKYHHS